MSIRHLFEKIKGKIWSNTANDTVEIVSYEIDGEVVRFPVIRRLFLSLVIILVATLSFGIGRLSVVGKREPIRIEYDPQLTTNNLLEKAGDSSQPRTQVSQTASVINSVSAIPQNQVVASKNGSKYHFLHCSGAKQIKEANKITFTSTKEAEMAGYTLASNCSPR